MASKRPILSDKPGVASDRRSLRAVYHIQCLEDRRNMRLYGLLRQIQLGCDNLVRLTFADTPQHLDLTRCQNGTAVAGSSPKLGLARTRDLVQDQRRHIDLPIEDDPDG